MIKLARYRAMEALRQLRDAKTDARTEAEKTGAAELHEALSKQLPPAAAAERAPPWAEELAKASADAAAALQSHVRVPLNSAKTSSL
jgi:hypothetical protein